MLVSGQQTHYIIDMKKDDVLFWYADIGWITGQTWTVYGSLITGGTSLFYDGILTYPTPDRWCKVIEKYSVSIFGIAPTSIRLFMRDNNKFTYIDSYDFRTLRILTTTGEPINREAWIWYFNKVGKVRCPLINLSGGTEIGGAILSTTFLEYMKPCSVGFPIPGFYAAVFDDLGNETTNGFWL
jgi:acetyl-CoA synthetase